MAIGLVNGRKRKNNEGLTSPRALIFIINKNNVTPSTSSSEPFAPSLYRRRNNYQICNHQAIATQGKGMKATVYAQKLHIHLHTIMYVRVGLHICTYRAIEHFGSIVGLVPDLL